MLKAEKRNLAQELKELIKEKGSLVVVQHEKITFDQIDQARREAQEGTVIKKVKNKIASNAFKGTNYESSTKDLKNENFLVFSNDIFNACKAAAALAKEAKEVQILGAGSQEETYDKERANKIAEIGSLDNLKSLILSMIKEAAAGRLLRLIKAKHES